MKSYSRRPRPSLLTRVCLAASLFLAALALHGPAWPQEPEIPGVGQINSLEELLEWTEAEKDKTESRSDLGELKKADLLNAYNDAMRALEAAQEYRDKEQAYQKIIELGQDKVQSMKKKLEDLETAKTADPSLPDSMPMPEAEQLLIKMQSEHAALESRLIEIQNILDELKTRPAKVQGQVAEARKALLELGNQLVVIPGTTESPQQKDAYTVRLHAQRMERENEVKMLEQELLSYPTQTNLLTAEQELIQKQLLLSGEKLQQMEAFVSERGQAEARQAQEESAIVEKQASGKHPEILKIAAENAELSQELVVLAKKLAEIRTSQNQHEDQAKQIEQDFRSSKQRLEIAGLSDARGQFMSNEQQKLPD